MVNTVLTWCTPLHPHTHTPHITHTPHRRNQNLRLNFTLTPGEATNGVGYPSKLSKEQESGLDNDHIYDEPSKYFTDNLSGSPPSYNKPDTNFDQKMLSDLNVNPSPPRTTRGALPAPPIGNGNCKNIDNKEAFAEPEYDELGLTPKQDAIPGQPDYSELDVNKMPSLRYGNIGVSDVVPNISPPRCPKPHPPSRLQSLPSTLTHNLPLLTITLHVPMNPSYQHHGNQRTHPLLIWTTNNLGHQLDMLSHKREPMFPRRQGAMYHSQAWGESSLQQI